MTDDLKRKMGLGDQPHYRPNPTPRPVVERNLYYLNKPDYTPGYPMSGVSFPSIGGRVEIHNAASIRVKTVTHCPDGLWRVALNVALHDDTLGMTEAEREAWQKGNALPKGNGATLPTEEARS